MMCQLRIRLLYQLLTKIILRLEQSLAMVRNFLIKVDEVSSFLYISSTFPYHQLLQSDISRQKLFLTFNVLLPYIPTEEVKRCITAVLYCTLTFSSLLQILPSSNFNFNFNYNFKLRLVLILFYPTTHQPGLVVTLQL